MQGDLISRSALMERLKEEARTGTIGSDYNMFEYLINEQPTAYDVEKVVDRIKELGTQEDGFPQVIGKETAINVIRNGGKE